MLTQQQVEAWLRDFVRRMRDQFGERLIFVGHHGSWARGEGRPDSDIDTLVVLETVGVEESEAYRDLLAEMGAGHDVASGVLLSAAEIASWPSAFLLQFFQGRKVLHGSLDGLAAPPSGADLVERAREAAAYNLNSARHYLIYPHDLAQKVNRTGYIFKECLWALQGFLLATTGTFPATKKEVLEAATEPEDRTLVEIVQGWREGSADRQARPEWYFRQLENWCSRMVVRAAEQLEAG